MNRQQRRAAERKEQKAKVKTYNLTEAQLQAYVRQAIEKELKNNHEEVMNESINTAMILLLTLPLEVLMDSGIHEICVGILRTLAEGRVGYG